MGVIDRFETVQIQVADHPHAAHAVVEGEGSSEIGGRSVRWQKNDVFTVPHWTWATHRANTGARLFYFTDREVLRRLNWLREETRA